MFFLFLDIADDGTETSDMSVTPPEVSTTTGGSHDNSPVHKKKPLDRRKYDAATFDNKPVYKPAESDEEITTPTVEHNSYETTGSIVDADELRSALNGSIDNTDNLNEVQNITFNIKGPSDSTNEASNCLTETNILRRRLLTDKSTDKKDVYLSDRRTMRPSYMSLTGQLTPNIKLGMIDHLSSCESEETESMSKSASGAQVKRYLTIFMRCSQGNIKLFYNYCTICLRQIVLLP